MQTRWMTELALTVAHQHHPHRRVREEQLSIVGVFVFTACQHLWSVLSTCCGAVKRVIPVYHPGSWPFSLYFRPHLFVFVFPFIPVPTRFLSSSLHRLVCCMLVSKKYDNKNGKGVFPPVSVCFHPYICYIGKMTHNRYRTCTFLLCFQDTLVKTTLILYFYMCGRLRIKKCILIAHVCVHMRFDTSMWQSDIKIVALNA